MGDHYARINQAEASAKHFIVSLFSRAKKEGLSSDEIHDAYREYREKIKINEYPRYVSSYLRGVFDGLNESVHRHDIEFCYIINDKRYSVRRESPLYYEKHGFSPKELHDKASHSGHFWIVAGKPYYVSSMGE